MQSPKLLTAAMSLLVATTAFAQTAMPVVTERQDNQKPRSAEGVKSAEPAKPEAGKLRAEQRAIRAEKRMASADGEVTDAERAKLTHDQNKASQQNQGQKPDTQKKAP